MDERFIFAAGGLVVGGALGFLITRSYLKKSYAEFADREIHAVKEFYKARSENPPGEDSVETEVITWVEEKKEEKVAYEKILSEKGYDDEEPKAIGPELGDDIYPITQEDWYLSEIKYDHVPLTWFMEDNTLCDDDDRLVEDVAGTVSEDFHLWFDEYHAEDKDTLFVRNTNLLIDFEIAREEGSYLDAIGSL